MKRLIALFVVILFIAVMPAMAEFTPYDYHIMYTANGNYIVYDFPDVMLYISGLQFSQLHGGFGKDIAFKSRPVDEVPHQDPDQSEYNEECYSPSENRRIHTVGADNHQHQKINQNQHNR